MKIYKKKTVKVVDQILCDCCGQSCSNEYDHEFAAIEAKWGYCSNQDGIQYDIQICETCFTEVLNFIKDKRRKVLEPFNFPHEKDPLEGRCYFPS
jgi:hypothetical protein